MRRDPYTRDRRAWFNFDNGSTWDREETERAFEEMAADDDMAALEDLVQAVHPNADRPFRPLERRVKSTAN